MRCQVLMASLVLLSAPAMVIAGGCSQYYDTVIIIIGQDAATTTQYGDADIACANVGATIAFTTGDGKHDFAATFGQDTPFVNGHRFHKRGSWDIDRLVADDRIKGGTFKYDVCYYPDKKARPVCKDPKIIVQPVSTVLISNADFGAVSREAHQLVRVTSSGDSHLTIEAIIPLDKKGPFDVKERKCEGGSCEITVSFDPRKAKGRQEGRFLVKYTGGEQTILVTGYGQ